MVNSKKKMNKSTVAIVVLALLLVLSLVLTATGAWFTDSKKTDETEITMGTINISTSDGAVSVTKDVTDGNFMPGDKINVTGAIKNTGDKAWVRYKLTHTYDGDNQDLKNALDTAFTGAYVYVETALDATTGTKDLTSKTTIPTSLGNTAQGATFGVTLVIEAIQYANNHAGTCQEAFTAAGFETTEVPARV